VLRFLQENYQCWGLPMLPERAQSVFRVLSVIAISILLLHFQVFAVPLALQVTGSAM